MRYAREHDGAITFGAGGNWTSHDFLRIKMENAGGFKFKRMPFAGGAPAMQSVAGGNCDVASPFLPEIVSMIDSGLLLPLAVAFTGRVAQLPDVPATAECGYPDIVEGIWRALSLPKQTPKPIVDYLAHVVEQTLNNAEFKADAVKLGINPVFMNTEALAAFLDKEFAFYEEKTKEWGIRIY
jgi:tripartite-type tricarboxylate transporter receptor subunit TctC